jgi:putative heme-binding domain-containing protein
LALTASTDAYLAAAVMSSAVPHFGEIAMALAGGGQPQGPLYESALSMAVATNDRPALARLLKPVLDGQGNSYSAGQFKAFARYLNDAATQHHDSAAPPSTSDDELAAQLGRTENIFSAARKAVRDEQRPVDLRVAAVALLGREKAHEDEDAALLSNQLGLHVPAELQTAAVAILGRTGRNDVPDLLARDWAAHSPRVRGAAIDVLLKRPAWAAQLLEKVQSNVIPRIDLDTAHRERLLHSDVESIRVKAQKVLADVIDTQRQQVIDRYQAALQLKGDPMHGAKLFIENCAVCHRKNGVGADIGPDLGSVSAWQPLPLLVAILDPSRQVEPRYFAYTVTLNDGDSVYGVITSETGASLAIKGLDGKERTFVRSQIKSMVGTGRSLMPDGLEAALNPQSMADVIQFLQTTRIVPK